MKLWGSGKKDGGRRGQGFKQAGMQGPSSDPMSMAETMARERGFPEKGLCSGPRVGCMATVLARDSCTLVLRYKRVRTCVSSRRGGVEAQSQILADPCFGSQLACSPAAQLSGQVASCRGNSRNGCTAALDCNRGPLPLGKGLPPIHQSTPHLCISSGFKPHALPLTGRRGARFAEGQQG